MSDLFYEIKARVINEDGSDAHFAIHARPCPFCSSKPVLECFLGSKKWFIECSDEKGDCLQPVTGSFLSPEVAAAQWNKRPLNG